MVVQVAATHWTREIAMPLDFIGIDPNTGDNESVTVWIEDEAKEIIIQGITADEELNARIGATGWVPGHAAGIPAHETVIRIPARMVPVLRKACDAAERAGLYDPAEGGSPVSGPSGDA
jgi:hypothetical protein